MITKLTKYLNRLGVKDEHAALEIAHDVLLDPKAAGYEFRKAKLLAYNYFNADARKKSVPIAVYLDETVADDYDSVTNYELIAYEDSNEISAALQENQRQLIERLVDDADERTTLIVQTFLETDKPTVNSIAAKLNIHHVTVQRALTRLQRNYSENLYGDLSDYLSA